MLSGSANVEDLVEALEVRFLANRDENLHFALLTDFRDACEETLPEDEPLLRLAQQGIEELNAKYGGATGERFLPLPSPPPVECSGTALDGLRAEARKAGRT